MTDRLRVAVVGGGVGKQHIEAWQQLDSLYDLVAFCDVDPGRAEQVASKYGITTSAANLNDLLIRQDIDLIDLATPPGLHVEQIKAVLAAGKDVICEKPLAASLSDIDALAEAEAVSGRNICPIFQYRFGGGFQKLQHLKAKGVLGRPYIATVETHWKRLPVYYQVPWRGKFRTELGGCLVSHAIHAHDMLVSILGPVANLHARTATRVNPIEVEDCAILSLEMESGALAALSVTLGAAEERSRLRFHFENLTAESSLGPYDPQADPWRFLPMHDENQARIDEALSDFEPGPLGFVGQFKALHAALTAGEPLPVRLDDSRRSIELFSAAYFSASSGDTVALPLSRDHPAFEGWPKVDA
ncbi:MAG: Gfo/Idh/MocA family oxidoreductase [Pseudomonadota bacterium]